MWTGCCRCLRASSCATTRLSKFRTDAIRRMRVRFYYADKISHPSTACTVVVRPSVQSSPRENIYRGLKTIISNTEHTHIVRVSATSCLNPLTATGAFAIRPLMQKITRSRALQDTIAAISCIRIMRCSCALPCGHEYPAVHRSKHASAISAERRFEIRRNARIL